MHVVVRLCALASIKAVRCLPRRGRRDSNLLQSPSPPNTRRRRRRRRYHRRPCIYVPLFLPSSSFRYPLSDRNPYARHADMRYTPLRLPATFVRSLVGSSSDCGVCMLASKRVRSIYPGKSRNPIEYHTRNCRAGVLSSAAGRDATPWRASSTRGV